MAYNYALNGVPKLPEIELGARVCKLIKDFYFADKPWIEAKQPVADTFTKAKAAARKMYPDMDETQMLMALGKYDKFDMDLLIGT